MLYIYTFNGGEGEVGDGEGVYDSKIMTVTKPSQYQNEKETRII